MDVVFRVRPSNDANVVIPSLVRHTLTVLYKKPFHTASTDTHFTYLRIYVREVIYVP